jgi:nucleotidyltransferase/DNA polymerase involved in DNA repair
MSRILALVWPELRAPDTTDAVARSWEPMLDALDDLSPRIEAVDVGVALVDVTGLGPLWGPERRVAARAVALVRAVARLHVRCGIGDNRWLATLAARLARPDRPDAPAALRVLERAELPDLPLDLLPADAATRQRFGRFGLMTMSQLAALPRSAVGAQFGPTGERLQALARGHDPRPLVPRRRPERVARHATFEPALEGVGAVGLTLRRLAAELCDRLRARHLAPGRATVTLRLEDAPSLRVAQAFPQPALEPGWIARLLLSRIEAAARARSSPSCRGARRTAKKGPETADPWLPDALQGNSWPRSGPKLAVGSAGEQLAEEPEEPRVASVTLAFDRLADPATRQMPAFEARAARWEELRWSLERIRHRFGGGRLWRAVVDRPMAALPEHRFRLAELDE